MLEISEENALIFEEEIFVYNQRLVNNAYLSLMVGEVLNFSEEEIMLLASIAWQCPWSGGDAVFQARALLSLEQDNYYNDELLCTEGPQMRHAPKEETDLQVSIFPNPADEWINIQINQGQVNRVEVYNNLGQPVKVTSIHSCPQDLVIFTKDWSTGVYYVRIELKDGKHQTTSFVINR